MEEKRRIYYLDVLNVISALSVVFLHVNGCFWSYSGEQSLSWWKSANIIESTFYFAVPVFFMITGATLLDYNKHYGLRTYMKKRINKTFIPYVIWSLLGLAFCVLVLKNVNVDDINAKFIIKGLVENTFIGIYWFFTPLFCAYLSIPLLAAVEQKQKVKIYSYAAMVAFIINIMVPFINNVFKLEIQWGYQIAVASGYLFYVLMGYVICNTDIKRNYRIIFYIVAIAGLLAQIIGTYNLTSKGNEIVQTYKGYNNVPCVLYSVGIFVFVKYAVLRVKDSRLKVFTVLSKYTFGVYLLHIFILRSIEKIFKVDTTNLWYRLFTPFAIFALAVMISWIIKKIPILKKSIP